MRIHAEMHGETRGKTGKIPGRRERRERKRGRFQEDEKEGEENGKVSLPERGKMDTGKQQKGGRFREKGKILDGRGR